MARFQLDVFSIVVPIDPPPIVLVLKHEMPLALLSAESVPYLRRGRLSSIAVP
jgi:hypothetical protein